MPTCVLTATLWSRGCLFMTLGRVRGPQVHRVWTYFIFIYWPVWTCFMFICSACVWTCLIFICSFIRPTVAFYRDLTRITVSDIKSEWIRHHPTRNNIRKNDTGLTGTMHYDVFRRQT